MLYEIDNENEHQYNKGSTMSAILEATNINKIYDEGAVSTQVLTG